MLQKKHTLQQTQFLVKYIKNMKNHTDHKKGWDTLRNTGDVRMLIADVITERHQEYYWKNMWGEKKDRVEGEN